MSRLSYCKNDFVAVRQGRDPRIHKLLLKLKENLSEGIDSKYVYICKKLNQATSCMP